MVFSKGQYGQPNCIYVQPFSAGTQFEFKIYYNNCGTKPDLGGRFYENTIIIQYDADLIEVSQSENSIPLFAYISFCRSGTKLKDSVANGSTTTKRPQANLPW